MQRRSRVWEWIVLGALAAGLPGCGSGSAPAEQEENPDGRPSFGAEGGAARPEGASPETLPASGAAGDPSGEPSGRLPADRRPAVLFFGTSLTAGYGLDDPDRAFPALIQEKLDSAGLEYRSLNAGVPGETSAAGLRRIGWVLAREDVEAVVVELGANDGLRGQDPEALRENLEAVIDSTRAHHPDATVVLAGMEAPPNLGPRYTEAFRTVFREVARENDADLIPFLLEGVAGEPELNQSDRIHPTAEGHRLIARNVWPVLASVLEERSPAGPPE